VSNYIASTPYGSARTNDAHGFWRTNWRRSRRRASFHEGITTANDHAVFANDAKVGADALG